MTLTVIKASNETFKETVEINTVEELFDFLDENGGHDLIISRRIAIENEDGTDFDEVCGIEIYDDYREQGLTKLLFHDTIKTVKEREELKMYIIHEENHSCLCVAENLGKGIMWLIDNDWLDGSRELFNYETCEDCQVKDLVKGAEEDPYLILTHLIDLTAKEGTEAVIEWLENVGFGFHEIEVA